MIHHTSYQYMICRMREASGLVRSGRIFGGLIDDLKRKKPFYVSDFLHAVHPQCISSFLFMYFACLAPIVAFGGLLGEATENRIATIESLISGKHDCHPYLSWILFYPCIEYIIFSCVTNYLNFRFNMWCLVWTMFWATPDIVGINWAGLCI